LLILALETATEVGSVALLEDARLLADVSFGTARHHAASVLVATEQVLEHGGRRQQDVEAIALSIGPGSFTGLRIGLATALGLCFGTPRRVLPVPTLAALALQAGSAARVVPMLDARRGQIYTGLYAPGGVPLLEDRLTDPRAWLESLRSRQPLVLLGPGARLYRNEIESCLGEGSVVLPAHIGAPRASNVGLLGAELAKAGQGVPAPEVELRYLRPSDAEASAGNRDTPGRN
jgi:tRNA threonylcarbamoyladenosine biosynthesis protein TsaB